MREYPTMLRLTMKYLSAFPTAKCRRGQCGAMSTSRAGRAGESTLGERTEIKNMNSFSFMSKAIEYEFERQKNILNSGNAVKRQTLAI